MSIESLVDTIVGFVREHEAWAAPVTFLVAFGESVAFLSLVWPGTAILVAVTALLAASGVSSGVLMPSILAAGLGGSLGYAISYWIGLYFKDSIPGLWPFRTHPHLIPRGQQFFEKYGAFGVFLGHFFGPVRAVIPVVAGMFAMRQLPFQIANFASAFLWAAGVIAPVFLGVTYKDEIYAWMVAHEWLVAVVMLLLALANAVPQLFLFWPTLVLFAGLGFIHLMAGGDLLPLLVAGALGAFVGDIVFYRLRKGRRNDLSKAWYINEEPEALEGAGQLVERWGALSVIMSKGMGLRRAIVPLMAGARDMPLAGFLAASALSSLIWAAVLLCVHPVYRLVSG